MAGSLKRQAFKVGRLVLAAVALISLARPVVSSASRVAEPQMWVVTTGTFAMLSSAAPGVGERLFVPSRSVVLGFDQTRARSATALSWASEAAFELAIRNLWIPASVNTVMYDPENWPNTPVGERVDPVRAMNAFAAAARAHGYRVILTPHPSLVTVSGGACTVRPGEAIEDAYVRCDIAGQAAKVADIVETQAQYLEGSPQAYRELVEATAEQARAANPHVLFISGLSTNFVDSPTALYAAWDAVRDIVDGHYLAIPGGRKLGVAADFVKLLP